MNKSFTRSSAIMERARHLFPGGVNSPVRSFRSVGGTPIVFQRGEGKFLYDVDGNKYIDFCASWGPLILGYSHPSVVKAVSEQAQLAMTFGAPCEGELALAEKIKSWIPGLDMLRFVSSGTEATMSAMRVARGATGKNKIIKFEGCYHGHCDSLLVAAGSGLATLGSPDSAGVTQGSVADTVVVAFNDQNAVALAFQKHAGDVAAIIIEPMANNMGLVQPEKGFLEFLREITKQNDSLLIFDEVMTGFRIAKGGAAERYGVEPDLWAFGKIIGGGLPAAAYGGKLKYMESVAPLGKTYQAGTLSGNPLAMAAGLATLNEMEKQNAFVKLEDLGQQLDKIVADKLGQQIAAAKLCYVRQASFFCFFFGTATPPKNFREVCQTDMALFKRVYHAWVERGIYMGPSGFEVGFISTQHTSEDFLELVQTIADTL